MKVFFSGAFFLFSFCLLTISAAFSSDMEETYMSADKSFYPYAPSLVKWEKSSADFTPPETCAECHPDKYDEWRSSMHALAFRDPLYQGELHLAVKSVGKEISRQCEGCHTPAAVVKGEIKDVGLKGLSSLALAGVSCDVCHSVKGHTHWQTPYHQPENGSLILSPGEDGKNSETGENYTLTKYGPKKPDEWCGDTFHECRYSPLHTSSELCASCHQVSNYRTHTPIEETYREWKNGPYSINNIHCQDCHMVDTETFMKVADTFAKPEPDAYHHYFNGANFLIYYLTKLAALKAGEQDVAANADAKYQMAVDRLKAAADLEITPVYRKDSISEIRVRVKNIRAGHYLTTSLTNIRQMWLEVTVKDKDGNLIMTTGGVAEDGTLPDDIRMFNSDTQDRNLNYTINPWEAETFSRTTTIPPKGYRDVHYGLGSPKGEAVTVTAILRYRQAGQKVAEKLLGMLPDDIHLEAVYGIKKIPDLPVIDMVSRTKTFR
ncbi:Cytochrome c family protein [Desulfamplus magnetovallimortis]|uniref:Cytochrome c family protein n=1 Tax=Desulfamplus magnetovallimortis TaxID=1246637 RepID=A0A1W1H824_9BACT|nr:cytochrome c family protein [Desulfamplus magnetovallimortis]SLM28622.1 Cytochrome c family protein [Desulfamplus magnetovallimortis]